jgi:hypothetical protein
MYKIGNALVMSVMFNYLEIYESQRNFTGRKIYASFCSKTSVQKNLFSRK